MGSVCHIACAYMLRGDLLDLIIVSERQRRPFVHTCKRKMESVSMYMAMGSVGECEHVFEDER